MSKKEKTESETERKQKSTGKVEENKTQPAGMIEEEKTPVKDIVTEESLPKEKIASEPEVSPQDARIIELEAEVSKLITERTDEKATFLRKLADMDNYRKRLVREKETAVQFANERLLNDLISILDDFDRAIEAGDRTDDMASYADGIKLIHKRLIDVLGRNWGLKRMDDIVGKEFSPHEHEAVMMEEGDQFDTETVLAELQKGYYLHDRVLRTAKVKVGKPL